MDAGRKVLRRRQLHFLDGKRDRPCLPAGVDDLVGGDAVEPGAEGRPFRPVAGQCPQDGDEDGLGQVHGVLLAAGLAADEAVDLVIVGSDQLLRRIPGVSPLDGFDPFLFLLHRLTAFHQVYSFVPEIPFQSIHKKESRCERWPWACRFFPEPFQRRTACFCGKYSTDPGRSHRCRIQKRCAKRGRVGDGGSARGDRIRTQTCVPVLLWPAHSDIIQRKAAEGACQNGTKRLLPQSAAGSGPVRRTPARQRSVSTRRTDDDPRDLQR